MILTIFPSWSRTTLTHDRLTKQCLYVVFFLIISRACVTRDGRNRVGRVSKGGIAIATIPAETSSLQRVVRAYVTTVGQARSPMNLLTSLPHVRPGPDFFRNFFFGRGEGRASSKRRPPHNRSFFSSQFKTHYNENYRFLTQIKITIFECKIITITLLVYYST